jgi:hypothetical protein
MQSVFMAIRSFLMISCMIIVPVLAIFGTDWLKQFGIGGSHAGPRRTSAAARRVRGPVGPNGLTETSNKTPPTAVPGSFGQPPLTPTAPPQTPPKQAIAPPTTTQTSAVPSGTSPTVVAPNAMPGWPPGVSAPPASQPVQANFEAPLQPAAGAQAAPMVPVNRGNTTTTVAAASNAPPAKPGAGGSNDWFTWTQRRLRDLGATYYLLETWGRDGELYRFHCKMAVAAGNPDYTRHFEATDSDASRAMQQVLEQVEAWRSGRSP